MEETKRHGGRRVGAGRKPKTEDGTRPTIATTIPVRLFYGIQVHKQNTGKTMTDILTEALTDYFEKAGLNLDTLG